MDSGPLIAAFNDRDPDHSLCADLFRRGGLQLVISALVVAEVCYHLGKHSALAEARFIEAMRRFDVETPETTDWARMGELVRRYAELGLGGTDASVVALAERLDARTIITLDQRHFRAVRPLHCEAFTLLPE